MTEADTVAPKPRRKAKAAVTAKRWLFLAVHLAAYAPDDPARTFAADVEANPDEHNRWVHLACRRHALDLIASNKPGFPFVYDARRGDRPAAFAEQFCGLEGPLAGQPLRFLEWQRFIVAQVYGWRHRSDVRKRRYQYAYTEVPRKNGKTGFVAPLGLYQLAFPPPNARCDVYSVATKKDQAKIVWKDACRLLRTAVEWAAIFRKRVDTLTHSESDSVWTPVGSDSDTLDGLRPELAIMDELHKWPGRGLWDVFNSAFGAAFSPLIFQITTAGKDPEGVCFEQRTRVTRILEAVERGTYTGEESDQSFYFGCIWTIDEDDDWQDPVAWKKANPSLGLVKPLAEMQKLLVGAISSPGARRSFLLDHLNVWQVTGEERWLDPAMWACGQAGEALKPDECWERLRGLKVWGAFDLGSTTDSSSFSCIAEDPADLDRTIAAWDFWLPGDDLAGRCARDNQPYDLWAREGWLKLTSGSISDVTRIHQDIVTRLTDLGVEIVGISYDPGWAQGLGQKLQDENGFPMTICPQRYATMTVPLDEIERRVITARILHGGNPLAATQAAAAITVSGSVGGRMLAKRRSKSRIDGMAALAMAFAARQHTLTAEPVTVGMTLV